MSARWEIAATYLKGMRDAVRAEPELQRRVFADAACAQVLANVGSQPWWPGSALVRLIEVLGEDDARRLAITVSHQAMHPMMRSAVSAVMMLSTARHDVLFNRLQVFVSGGVRGVRASFTPRAGGGTARYEFPEPVPPMVDLLWDGLYSVAFKLTGSGRVVSRKVEPTVHEHQLAWA